MHRKIYSLLGAVTGIVLACAGGGCAADENAPPTEQGSRACASEHGPQMAEVEVEGDRFCIDRTEVSRAHYAAFVDAGSPTLPGIPSVCEPPAEPSYLPEAECLEAPQLCQGEACGEHPQTCVTWCEAAAFCAWAGKELCSESGGGYVVRGFDDSGKLLPMKGRWLAACGGGFTDRGQPRVTYSYASRYEPGRCNAELGKTAPVGITPGCQTFTSADVVDMIGNVSEWNGVLIQRNASEPVGRPIASGGAAFLQASRDNATCGTTEGFENVHQRSASIGFRCCKNAE